MRILLRSFHPSSHSTQPETPPKPKENYKDVQDAKYVELSNDHEENTSEPNT